MLDISASSWTRGASAFAERCVDAGSPFATFFVGSVLFYTSTGAEAHQGGSSDSSHASSSASSSRDSASVALAASRARARGASLLARAAVAGSEEAHHTLAVVHFNGSGGGRRDKDPEAGAALLARGNLLFGSVAAKRELGHCLQDGFGVERDPALGRRLLREAAAEDARAADFDTAVAAATAAAAEAEERLRKRNDITTLQAAVDAAAEVSQAASDAAAQHLTHLVSRESRFLLEWFGPSAGSGRSSSSEKTRRRPPPASSDAAAPAELCHPLAPGTTLCSHPLCGRPETRRHEFRRCSCCGRVRYCSRSCQSSDWRLQHKFACLPLLELYGWIESDTESELDAEEAAAAEAEAEAEAEASEEELAARDDDARGGAAGEAVAA